MSLCYVQYGYAQHQDLQEKPKIWQSDNKQVSDSLTILGAFKNGTVHGHFRYFFSATQNQGDLSDYFANAVGGGIRYETGNFRGFNIGVSGFYIFNLASSDLLKKDESTGQANRYELGLFDIANTTSIDEINRVEEFFIKYQYKGLKAIFGRQLLNTPFINLQDGRMRPTAVEGIWLEQSIDKHQSLQVGWLYSIAPRSTSKWYRMSEGIGIFPGGVDQNGLRSQYAGNVVTKGAFLANYKWQIAPNIQINVWDMFLENIFNTTLLQIEAEHKLSASKVYAGSQTALQTKVGNGGNKDQSLSFNTNTKDVWIIGARAGWKNKVWDHSLNFNRISNGGRYLMPREFGRDYFYTFMPRERNEGFGDVTAVTLKTIYKPWANTTINPAFGYFAMPDVKDFYLNKYGVPSYTQLDIDVRHKFGGLLQGLEAQILYVHKWNQGETYGNNRFVIHKVDMDLVNVVLNFRF
jgi:hypothetical protein